MWGWGRDDMISSWQKAGALALMATSTAALAEGDRQRTRDTFVTVYASKWSDIALNAFPLRLVTGDLRFRPTYFVAVGVNHVVIPDFTIHIPATGIRLRKTSLEVEGQLVKHFGIQDHIEATGALVVRSGEIPIGKRPSLNLAIANGLSYAFERPKYELGPSGKQGVDSRYLQYHIGLEAELTPSPQARVHLVAKLHHRSGIYGVISPRTTGSNFIGAGLRFDL